MMNKVFARDNMVGAWVLLILLYYLPTSYATDQPHILFIMADDYGWNDIGYHKSEIPTPNLDKLAASGIKLENYYVQPVCTPSRASLMTGRYPIRYGLQHDVIQAPQPAGLRLNETTLARKLREAGYSTHAIGKWHLGFFKWDYTPTYRGFDTHVGYYAGGEDYFSHNASWVWTGFDFRNNTKNYVSAKGEYSSSVFEREALRIIDQYADAPPSTRKPLFIYLAMQTCHMPLEVPPEYKQMCSFISTESRQTYCGMAVNMDLTIANITKGLEKAGILNNTLIVFSTDNGGLPSAAGHGNGGASNWPLRGGKFTLWEGGVHGISFVTGAGIPKNRQGSTYNGLMHITDWFPTLIGVGKGSTNGTNALDGINMWKAITSGGASPRLEILHNIDEVVNNSALRRGDWKIVVGPQQYSGWYAPPKLGKQQSVMNSQKMVEFADATVRLFNITEDPTEKNDLAEQHPNIVQSLLARIDQYKKGMVPPWNEPNDPASNPKNFDGNWMPWKE